MVRVEVVQLSHDGCGQEADVGFGGGVVMDCLPHPCHHPLPHGPLSQLPLPLSHPLQFNEAPSLDLDGPVIGWRATAERGRTTTALVVVVHQGGPHGVHRRPLETTVLHGRGFGVNPRPFGPLFM